MATCSVSRIHYFSQDCDIIWNKFCHFKLLKQHLKLSLGVKKQLYCLLGSLICETLFCKFWWHLCLWGKIDFIYFFLFLLLTFELSFHLFALNNFRLRWLQFLLDRMRVEQWRSSSSFSVQNVVVFCCTLTKSIVLYKLFHLTLFFCSSYRIELYPNLKQTFLGLLKFDPKSQLHYMVDNCTKQQLVLTNKHTHLMDIWVHSDNIHESYFINNTFCFSLSCLLDCTQEKPLEARPLSAARNSLTDLDSHTLRTNSDTHTCSHSK